MISKLAKLKGRSFAELADRGRQKAASLAERIGVSPDSRPLSDDAFLRLFEIPQSSDASLLLEKFREREAKFYPLFNDRPATITALRASFPAEEEAVIRQAEKVVSGRFDLLGYTDLDFGKPIPDWHFEPVSGNRSRLLHRSRITETDASETSDKKVVWELNRHQYFTLLGRAYWLTGDEMYAQAFSSHLENWIENNPPKLGINWTSSLEIAYRSISWIWAYHFFRDSSKFGPETFLKMLKCLNLSANHLQKNLSTYSSPNTHLTGEALGLYVIGGFLSEINGAFRWRETGYQVLIKALEYQIRDDGGYAEQATQYHRYTADIYLSLYILRQAEGLPIDEVHEQKLRKSLEFLMHLTQPNGETPLIGDDDGGRLHFLHNANFTDFRSTLAVGAAVLGHGRLKFVAGNAGPELLWLTGAQGLDAFNRLESQPVSERSKAFEQTGWYVIRDGWEADSNFVLIDGGEHGFMNGGHAHADTLGFVISVKGIPVFVDSGTYTYTADKASRDYFRSSSAHNCLTVNRQSSSVPGDPFSWKSTAGTRVLEWKANDTQTVFRGTHDGYERFGVRYEREFRVNLTTGISIIDKIATQTDNEFEISFILAPDIIAEVVDRTHVVLSIDDGKRQLLAITTEVIEEDIKEFGGWRVEPAQISPRYGSLVDTSRLLFSLTRDSSFQVENSFEFAGSF